MALVEPARYVRHHVHPERAQCEHERRKPGEPVRIEIPEDDDLLGPCLRLTEPSTGYGRVGQEPGVVEAGVGRPEPAIETRDIGSADTTCRV